MNRELGKEIGKRIKLARLNYSANRGKELTQSELASKVGVSRENISMIELGKTVPGVDRIVTIAEILGCTTDYLLGIDDNVKRANVPDQLKNMGVSEIVKKGDSELTNEQIIQIKEAIEKIIRSE